MSFVNLHTHSHYSLLDGFGSPEAIVLRAKELGCPAVALTDHGVTYGLVEFFNAAKKHDIKPVLGCEIYVAPRKMTDKDSKLDVKPYHLTLLAKNNDGYLNLLRLVTKANLEGFYYKPRVDYETLKEFSNGLIALSGCLVGHLPRMILSDNPDEVKKVIEQHLDIFGKDNYFLEMQDHPLIEDQIVANQGLRKLSKEYGLPLVVTNDSHYPRPEDSDAHDVLLCIQTGKNVNDQDRLRYSGDYSIRPYDDLAQAFPDDLDALENTVKIAEMCNVDFEFGRNLIPSFKTPKNEDTGKYLAKVCLEGLTERFKKEEVPKDYVDRLEYELGVVHKMGFDTYFLIVADFVRYAKEQKITVGPGRGSAAGSIIAWSLGITDLDPIEYGLFFERFLNPERVSMPDIDIDFADTRRDEVLDYVVEKYGRDNVAQILTFGTMASRAAVRDVGRALGYPYQEVDVLAKTVPPPVLGKHVPLTVTTKEDPDLKHLYDEDPRAKVLLDYAKRLEGSVRHVGTHACAVVISEEPLTNYTALQYGAGGNKEIVTQYSAKPLEKLGLLKMDFLGLKNLTVIERTVKIVKRTQNVNIDIDTLPQDDKKTFKLFQEGDTTGVFQFESAGMKRYLKDLKPTVFEDIVAMGALYRPGPMEWIPTYIKGKHSPEKVKYLHKSFKTILETTYGVAVYQEQILQLARDFAGFSLGEADILRKAVGKKIASLLVKQREKFVEGAVKNGHKEKFANEVFEKVIEPFAGYGFNKAHAACYGLIAYQTAYLKAHYPIEFMTALLCSDATNTDRVVLEIKECAEMGLEMLPPSINESFSNFTVIDKTKIRFGLLAIKGIGEGPVKEIIAVRNADGEFKSLEDFAKRVPSKILNKKVIQALAYTGAFDSFGDRNQIAENYEEISKYAKFVQDSIANGQTDIFGMMGGESAAEAELNLKEVPKSTDIQRLKWEKDLIGMYVSGHPLRGMKKYISRKGCLIEDLNEKKAGKNVKIVGLISNLRKILTKSGEYMATFKVEDPSAIVNGVMFPRAYAMYGTFLNEDSVIAFGGKLDNRRGQFQVICDVAKTLSIDVMLENAKEARLFDAKDKSGVGLRMIDDILDEKRELEGGTSESASSDSASFLIKVPTESTSVAMKSLKEFLLENKGETPVDLVLSNSKKIRLPFGIKLTDKVKSRVQELLV